MNVTQLENSYTYAERLPAQTTVDRMDDLCMQRRHELILIKNREIQLGRFDYRWPGEDWQASDRRLRLVNEKTQAELRLAGIWREIVNVARLIVAEADNSETLLAVLRMREQLAAETETT